MSTLVGEVKRIAVVRANALGDFIFSLPAMEALRWAYPDSEIVLFGLAWHAELVTGRPGPIDRVVPVPPWAGLYDEADGRAAGFFEDACAERFDLAVQMHGGGRTSNPFTSRLGARVTAGLRAEDAIPLDRWIPYVYYHPEVLRYLEVAALVGATRAPLEPRLAVTEADRAASLDAVPETGAPLVVVHPGARDPRRRWPTEAFAAVADRLAAEGGRVVLTGTVEEADLTADVADRMRAPAEDLTGRLSLPGLLGLLSRSALLVSNDTGPHHLARAIGTPAAGVFWCGNALNGMALTVARSRVLISWRLDCPVCGVDSTRGSCEHDASFVADVPVDDVLEASLDLVARRGAPGGRAAAAPFRPTLAREGAEQR